MRPLASMSPRDFKSPRNKPLKSTINQPNINQHRSPQAIRTSANLANNRPQQSQPYPSIKQENLTSLPQQQKYRGRQTYKKIYSETEQKLRSGQNQSHQFTLNNINQPFRQTFNKEQVLWRAPPIKIQTSFQNQIFDQPKEIQQFPNPHIKYKIFPVSNEKKSLDLTSIDDIKQGLKKNYLIIWDYHGGPNQQFYLKKSKNQDRYYIVAVSKGFTIQIPQFDKKQGVQIYASPKNQTDNQLWYLRPLQNNAYQIVSFHGLLLDVQNQSMKNGNKVIQWPRTGRKNQNWRIVPA